MELGAVDIGRLGSLIEFEVLDFCASMLGGFNAWNFNGLNVACLGLGVVELRVLRSLIKLEV